MAAATPEAKADSDVFTEHGVLVNEQCLRTALTTLVVLVPCRNKTNVLGNTSGLTTLTHEPYCGVSLKKETAARQPSQALNWLGLPSVS